MLGVGRSGVLGRLCRRRARRAPAGVSTRRASGCRGARSDAPVSRQPDQRPRQGGTARRPRCRPPQRPHLLEPEVVLQARGHPHPVQQARLPVCARVRAGAERDGCQVRQVRRRRLQAAAASLPAALAPVTTRQAPRRLTLPPISPPNPVYHPPGSEKRSTAPTWLPNTAATRCSNSRSGPASVSRRSPAAATAGGTCRKSGGARPPGARRGWAVRGARAAGRGQRTRRGDSARAALHAQRPRLLLRAHTGKPAGTLLRASAGLPPALPARTLVRAHRDDPRAGPRRASQAPSTRRTLVQELPGAPTPRTSCPHRLPPGCQPLLGAPSCRRAMTASSVSPSSSDRLPRSARTSASV